MLPTPAKMPSITSERTTGLTPIETRPSETIAVTCATPTSIRPLSHAPTEPNDSQKTSAMMRRNAGNAVYRPVRMRSIATERLCSRLSRGLTTHARQTPPMKPKRMSASAERRSLPDSPSIWLMTCSRASSSFSSRPSASRTSASPSTSLVAAKRGGKPARTA
ncbi:Uncharacterised protein [Collinsella intestinalis]|nr:Uncharacterised protein [Collinsella intestinalis]